MSERVGHDNKHYNCVSSNTYTKICPSIKTNDVWIVAMHVISLKQHKFSMLNVHAHAHTHTHTHTQHTDHISMYAPKLN